MEGYRKLIGCKRKLKVWALHYSLCVLSNESYSYYTTTTFSTMKQRTILESNDHPPVWQKKRLRWTGYLLRSKENILREVLLHVPEGGRHGRGRPCLRFYDSRGV